MLWVYLWIWQCLKRNHFIVVFLQQNIIEYFPRFLAYLCLGYWTNHQCQLSIHLKEWACKWTENVWVLPHCLWYYCTSISYREVTNVEHRVWGCVGSFLFLLVVGRVLSSTNQFRCKIDLETSLIFPCSMRYLRVVFRNKSLPIVSGEDSISLEIAWYIWSFHAFPVNDSTTFKSSWHLR